jgi:hypothetical protein
VWVPRDARERHERFKDLEEQFQREFAAASDPDTRRELKSRFTVQLWDRHMRPDWRPALKPHNMFWSGGERRSRKNAVPPRFAPVLKLPKHLLKRRDTSRTADPTTSSSARCQPQRQVAPSS